MMSTQNSERLDHYLVRIGCFRSRDRAKQAIVDGLVKINGLPVHKAAFLIEDGAIVELSGKDLPYVSRAALKLRAALDQFALDPQGKIALDIGVATGGFSQLLLERGARLVYGVDVGRGQISPELLSDRRLVFRNYTDARNLSPEDFPERPELIVVDVSFISIEALLPALSRLISNSDVDLIVLIKPQYEMGPGSPTRLKQTAQVQARLMAIKKSFQEHGLEVRGEISSPLTGKEGTQEYLWLVGRGLS